MAEGGKGRSTEGEGAVGAKEKGSGTLWLPPAPVGKATGGGEGGPT